jgi:VanZ family protein
VIRAGLFRLWTAPLSHWSSERWLRVIPLLLYLSGIYAMSCVPGPSVPVVVDDRIAHTLEYFGLGALLLFAFAPHVSYRLRAAHGVTAVAMAGLWGVSDEFHQSFVPLRDVSLKDLSFDLLGATLAVVIILAGIRWSER